MHSSLSDTPSIFTIHIVPSLMPSMYSVTDESKQVYLLSPSLYVNIIRVSLGVVSILYTFFSPEIFLYIVVTSFMAADSPSLPDIPCADTDVRSPFISQQNDLAPSL